MSEETVAPRLRVSPLWLTFEASARSVAVCEAREVVVVDPHGLSEVVARVGVEREAEPPDEVPLDEVLPHDREPPPKPLLPLPALPELREDPLLLLLL